MDTIRFSSANFLSQKTILFEIFLGNSFSLTCEQEGKSVRNINFSQRISTKILSIGPLFPTLPDSRKKMVPHNLTKNKNVK